VQTYGQIKIAAKKKEQEKTPPRSAKRVGRRLRKPDLNHLGRKAMSNKRRLKPTKKIPPHAPCVGEPEVIHLCDPETCPGEGCPNADKDLHICCQRGYDDTLALVQAATTIDCPACGGSETLHVGMGRQWLGEPRFLVYCHNECTEPDIQAALKAADFQPSRAQADWTARCAHHERKEIDAGMLAPPINLPPDDKPTALYRWWDAADLLLYIGISDELAERVKGHVKGSSWMDFAVRSTIERHPTRSAALDAEETAIKAERPLFNHQHNSTPEAQKRLVEYLIKHNRIDLLAPAVFRG
jgi:predicted GIY-YIG superfamily endonuclease